MSTSAAAGMLDLTNEQQDILATIRQFVDRDVIPNASRFDHDDEFPTEMVETMKQLGLYPAQADHPGRDKNPERA